MLEEYTYEEQESGRTETLIQALEKIERLEKQLEIAIKALETAHTYPSSTSLKEWCEQKIKQIKELEK